jgi:NTE family protein
MSMTLGVRFFMTVCVMLACAACAHYDVNGRTETVQEDSGYRFDTLPQHGNSDSLFICLSFSGGGTRAAALAYGVMEELKRARVLIDGVEKSLLDEVDCISSVSGGSFTAAYYGLFRERLFADFRGRFLDRNIERALIWRAANPLNWFRLASPTFGRIDLAVELYDDEVFDHRRVADLQRRGRPLVMINATNVESGSRFSFLPLYFDALGSDLEGYPVARAVAASSAFPFLLSPVTLVNYPASKSYQPPWWYEGAAESLHVARYRYQAAQDLAYYLDKTNRYVHLMDGGLADNIGVRAIYDAFARGFIRQRINDARIKRLVVIVVNARTEPQEDLGKRESPPGLSTVAIKTATLSMEHYSYESISLMVESLQQRVRAQKDIEACQRLIERSCPSAPQIPAFQGTIDPYVIEINFAGAAGLEHEDPNYYLNLPTSFTLDRTQVDKLAAIGPKLLRASPQFRCLTQVLAAEAAGKPRPGECPIGAGISGYE